MTPIWVLAYKFIKSLINVGAVDVIVVPDFGRSVREHSYMTSDVFGSFLTYLPTLIRYRQMWLDLPTYPQNLTSDF